MRAWAIAAALLVTSIGARTHIQPADDLIRYRHLIDAYRDGERVADTDVDRVLADAGAQFAARASEPASTWTTDDLKAAAMLHTDACLRLVKGDRRAEAAAHLEDAAMLLGAAIERDAADREYAVRWRDTVAGLLHAYGAPELEANVRARGSEWSRLSKDQIDARSAFAQGLTDEIQAAVAGRLSGPPPTRATPIAPDAIRSLQLAYDEYGAAVRLDPGFADAALHLGRVALLQRRDGDAVLHLRRASSAHSASIRYLASMFLGAAAERGGQLDEALDRYRHAADAFRWGQSAPLALSHALMRAGRDDEARAALMAHFAARGDRVFDPFWTYLANPDTDLGPTLDELRAEVWR